MMKLNFSDRKVERDRLYSGYLKLSSRSQLFVQMLLFGLDDMPSNYLLKYLEFIETNNKDFGFIRKDIKVIIKECKNAGVIVNQYERSNCVSLIINLCAKHSVESGNFQLINELFRDNPPERFRFYYHESDSALSEFNILRVLYEGTLEHYLQTVKNRFYKKVNFGSIQWHRYFNNPFNPDLLKNIDYPLLIEILRDVMADILFRLEDGNPICEFLENKIVSGNDPQGQFSYLLGSHLIITGQFEKFESLRNKIINGPGLIAFEAAVKGDNDTALVNFDSALKIIRKTSESKQVMFNDFSGVLYLICLIRSGSSEHISKLLRFTKQISGGNYCPQRIHLWIKSFSNLFDYNGIFLKGRWVRSEFISACQSSTPAHIWISLLVGYWLDEEIAKPDIDILKQAYEITKEHTFSWLASEMAELIFRITDDKSYESAAKVLRNKWTSTSLVDSVKKTESWERTLEILKSLSTESKKPDASVRLVWRVDPPEKAGYFGKIEIHLIEQKILKNGQWSAGKTISMNRIRDGYEYRDLLTEQDKKIIAFLQRSVWGNDFSFEALAELAGHPEVYRNDDPSIHAEIVLQEPYLTVLPEKNGFKVIMEPKLELVHNEKNVFIEETADRFVLYRINNRHVRIAEILGGNSFSVPSSAKDMLLEALRSVSPQIDIRTDLDQSLETSEEIKADTRPVVRLTGDRRGLKLEMMVRPIKDGKLFSIGKGPSIIYGTINAKQYHTVRNFDSENKELLSIVMTSSVLNEYLEESGTASISDPHDCLEILAELNSCDPKPELLWNNSTPLKINSTKSRSLSLRKSGDWFSLEGDVQIDDGQVITFRKLLELLDSSDGRFIKLDENRFLALTEEFRHQLEQIRSFSTATKSGICLHPLSSLALDLTEESSQVSVCKEWKTNIERIRLAFDKMPVLPATFQGELREYQREGFLWMTRLAEIGAGACLADDMGLGKTIQAIAVMLYRAKGGPALIIGPTSVCMNWVDEIRRFAPTLNPLLFSESDRETSVNSAEAGDVVICSYGLVNNESDLLASRKWNTIIVDEAQAIKNMMTQRSKAVMGLQGAFRIVTTGTPVENHLGELWNIFNFINPGLLGTIEEFNGRFANAIEQKNDPETRRHLKSIISPFILRRLKSQVLDELPPKTEVIIHVDMSSKERALYEALRRTALDELSSADKKGKHIKILAHIMKLRRACCHPSLVTQDITISGSKLESFGQCIDELLDNNHRALVFSQFVDHLSIVKSYCDKRNIGYQYLDGSTSARERSMRISAFQAGEGSLFLMSLKAGGVGINLTGADYVILLDPWWNPAVEDQASGRAYRMGQQRPVTIYRLITKGTIEEKIVELHKYKRDLAESLLEGGDMSGKVSAEELMKMIGDAV